MDISMGKLYCQSYLLNKLTMRGVW
jgi:hypothetical protein